MASILAFNLTTEGKAAAWNANSTGFKLDLTHIQFGSGNREPDGLETALNIPEQTAVIASGFNVSDNQIRMSSVFEGVRDYEIREVGVWAGDPSVQESVLFGYWSQPTGVWAYQIDGIDLVFTHDMVFDGNIPLAGITILSDNSQSELLGIISNHENSLNPHPVYLLKSNEPSQLEAELGIETQVKAWSALRVMQAAKIAALEVSVSANLGLLDTMAEHITSYHGKAQRFFFNQL